MISRTFDKYILVCDICGEPVDETFYDFYDAVAYKKEKGWTSTKINGQWQDACPQCQDK